MNRGCVSRASVVQASCVQRVIPRPASTILYRWDDIDFIRTLPAAALEDLARAAKMQPGHAAKFVALIGEQQAASHNSSVRCLLHSQPQTHTNTRCAE